MNAAKNITGKLKEIAEVCHVGKHGKKLCDLDIFFGALEEALLKL